MSGKSVVGSIIASVIIMSAITFLALPFIFPGVSEKNIVLQSKFGEWNSPAYIWDYDIAYEKMEDTEMNITIRENSRLAITFSAIAVMSLGPTFNGRSSYNISLVVEDIDNRTYPVAFFDESGATGGYRQISYNLHMDFVTQPLSAGTYTIEMYWMSDFDAPGDSNSLSVAHDSFNPYNYTRSLWVQELSTT